MIDDKKVKAKKAMSNEELCALIQEGNKEAKETLLLQNAGLIHKAVGLIRRKYGYLTVETEDLYVTGQMGLLHAATLFVPEFGTKFSTYAWIHICHAIRRCIVESGTMIRLPAYRHEQYIHCGENDDDVNRAMRVGSLNDNLYADGEQNYLDTMVDKSATPVDDYVEARVVIGQYIDQLTSREQEIIRLRYCENMTLLESGRALGITKERARQLEMHALNKLRDMIEGKYYRKCA